MLRIYMQLIMKYSMLPITRLIIETLDTFYQLNIDKNLTQMYSKPVEKKTISRCLILPVERIIGSIVPIIFDLCNRPFKIGCYTHSLSLSISLSISPVRSLSQHLFVINFNFCECSSFSMAI